MHLIKELTREGYRDLNKIPSVLAKTKVFNPINTWKTCFRPTEKKLSSLILYDSSSLHL